MATQSVPRITEEEYLRLERTAEFKSEFIDGEIFPMPGGTLPHAQIPVNVGAALSIQLRGRGARVFSSDLRIRTAASGAYVYPDMSVVAGTPQLHKKSNDILTNPTVVVEVLSPSTADYDHGRKFELYREIPSLADYILIHADTPLVEHFARQPDASWTFREIRGLESAFPIASVNCTLQLADVYADVFPIPE